MHHEQHAAWWLVGCVRQYISLLAAQAPTLLLHRELRLIVNRLNILQTARERADTAEATAVPDYVQRHAARLQETDGDGDEETGA